MGASVWNITEASFTLCDSDWKPVGNIKCPDGSHVWKSEEKLRLDKFLKVSRIIKRRTVANEACDAGRITVNGKVAKASLSVKPGDIIAVDMGPKSVSVEVLKIAETTKKDEAAELFKVL